MLKTALLLLAGVQAGMAVSFPADTTLAYTRMPAGVPIPAYLQSVIDPVFGTQVTRIADRQAMNSSREVLAHHYAKDQPWNADGSLIMLEGWPAAILDGASYELVRWIMPPGEHHTWSNTDPEIIYGVQQPDTFVKVSAVTGAVTVLRQFTEFTEVSYGAWEGNLSNDDRYIAFQVRAPEGNRVIVFDIPSSRVRASLEIGAAWPNNVSMSQSGRHVAIQWAVEGGGERQGIDIFTTDLAYERKVGTCGGCHYDLGYDTEGNEVAVMTDIDHGSRAMVMVDLATGRRTVLLRDDQMSWYIHVSCRNLDRPGWAYLTEFADPNTQRGKPNYQLAFAVRLDGSGTVERFAHVHHSATVAYERSPFGVPNRDGSRMMFRSDWEDASGPVYSYVAEMPRPESGSTDIRNTAPEASILAPSIRAFPNPCRGGTNIRYTLSNDENVTLAVYNLAGQCLLTLVQGVQPAGVHTVFFDGRMPAGRTLANGVYLCRLTGSGRTQTAKMIAGP